MRRGGQGTDPQRGDCVKTQGEDGCPQPRREALGETSPSSTLIWGPCSPQNFEKMSLRWQPWDGPQACVCSLQDAVWSTSAALPHGPVAPARVNRPGPVLPGFSLSFFP